MVPTSSPTTASDWRKLSAACSASGLSRSEFARTHGLVVSQVQYWFAKLARAAPAEAGVPSDGTAKKAGPPRFVPLRVTGVTEPLAATQEVRIRVGSDVVMEFSPGCSARRISEVARALAGSGTGGW